MGDDKRYSVMAVDLAIQRELAYRKKVEMLGLEPYGDCGWKEFLPLQVPSSSLISSVPGMKQATPSSSTLQRIVPRPIMIPTPNTIPKPWPSSSSSSSVAMKRKAPISSLQAPISSLKSCADNFFCRICQVSCSGPQNYKMHIRGRQHWAKLEEQKIGRKNSGQKANKLQRCELCKISCTDENALRLHLEGQKHKAKQQKLEVGGNDGGQEANQRQWCGLCKIWCMNESAFKQHLEGKKHITKLRTFKEKKGAEEEEAGLAIGWKDPESEMIWC